MACSVSICLIHHRRAGEALLEIIENAEMLTWATGGIANRKDKLGVLCS